MEELLNKLIEKGWKPFGEDVKQIAKNRLLLGYVSKTPVPLSTLECKFSWVLRELVSKESGLWQFVCENGMINKNKQYSFIKWSWKGRTDERNQKSYQYRLIESTLCDEDKLEQFLLDNIKVEGKND